MSDDEDDEEGSEMAFKNRRAARRIAEHACEMCGYRHVGRDAAHVIDEIEGTGGGTEGDWNALSLCPTCHRVFEDLLRPKLYRALQRFGAKELPVSWSKSNKRSKDDR